MLGNIAINSESIARVNDAVEEIKSCCEIEDDYLEWYDIAQECMQQCFEDLNDEQIKITCAAWFAVINESECNDNFVKGIICALEMCVEELISLKEDFIDEVRDPDDNYDVSEAEEIKSAYEKCLSDIRVVKKNIMR